MEIKVRMLQSLSGERESFAQGDIVDLTLRYGENAAEVAEAWRAGNVAEMAEPAHVAQARVTELEARHSENAAARSGLEALLADLKGQIAEAKAAASGAKAETILFRADASTLRNALADAAKALQSALDAKAAAERDSAEFAAQAATLGDEMAALKAQAPTTPPAAESDAAAPGAEGAPV